MREDTGSIRMLAAMKSVRGIVTHPWMPDGVPRPVVLKAGDDPVFSVELVRQADGTPACRDMQDGRVYSVENLPPFAHLRLTGPPGDDDGQ